MTEGKLGKGHLATYINKTHRLILSVNAVKIEQAELKTYQISERDFDGL